MHGQCVDVMAEMILLENKTLSQEAVKNSLSVRSILIQGERTARPFVVLISEQKSNSLTVLAW